MTQPHEPDHFRSPDLTFFRSPPLQPPYVPVPDTRSRRIGRMIGHLLPAPIWSAAYRTVRRLGAWLSELERDA